MSDTEKKSNGFPVEGLTVQGFGGALGALWMMHRASNGDYYQAGQESIYGTIIAGVLYATYWLLKPRILKWRRG